MPTRHIWKSDEPARNATGSWAGIGIDTDDDNLKYYSTDDSATRTLLSSNSTISGTGYSLNLIDVTSTTASGNTRGFRVNVTTSDSITHGDLQGVHGYLTLGSSVTLGTGAAVYPLSAWIDVPSDLTTGSGNIIAGARVIFDGNGLDLTSLAGGGESALIYAQTWGGVATQIDQGLSLVAGASTTIDSAIHLGGSGTFSRVIEATEWGEDTTMILLQGGPKDATAETTFHIAIGDATDSAGIVSALGGVATGSLFLSTAGTMWQATGASTWTQIS